ncbi:two-component system response regulator [Alteromonas sp. a30]|uniref:two-component system response regulator n=1 Tax=Alteromonas sp. a30 TaxID=2730917 RepID=UPI00227EF408|nr:EAL domain-containing protein [Alteromonas sp. a30]MCY7297149.1 EAL domain-containing protein [Alteromonas sp. a30]
MKKLDSLVVSKNEILSVVVIGGSEAENMRIDKMLQQSGVSSTHFQVPPVTLITPKSNDDNISTLPPLNTINAFLIIQDSTNNCGSVATIRQRYPHIPIIVIISHYDANLASDVLKSGAQECITQQEVSPELLKMLINNAQTRLQTDQHQQRALEDSQTRISELEKIAHTDYLTHIPNRASFNKIISRRLYNAMRSGKPVALIYLDLNDFKHVNDTFGHDAGDKLLQHVAKRLRQTCRSTDFLARLGGDEFAILTEQMDYRCEVFALIDRLTKAFEPHFNLNTIQLACRPAIGVAFYPDGQTPEVLAQQADSAMYLAKQKLSNPVCFYTKKMRHQFSRSLQIHTQIPNAIEQGEFDVHFQQGVDTHDSQHLVFEALLRWKSLFLGSVMPGEFIPALNKGEQENQLTLLVLQKSNLLLNLAPRDRKITIKINVTPSQIASLHYINQFIAQMEELNIPPHSICLEVGSKEVGQNPTRLLAGFDLIKQAGIRLSLDNFGVDDVSLEQLLNIPIDILSFDKEMTKFITQDEGKRAMIAGVVEMAHRLGIRVCVEGIEQEIEHEITNKLGCDFQQGFFYSEPKPLPKLF